MKAQSEQAAIMANGICSNCLWKRLDAGKKPTCSPVTGSVIVFSGSKSFFLTSILETPLTPQRTLRSTSWCFQYSVKTVHHRALARP